MTIDFDYNIPTSLSAQELWRELTRCFEDSDASALWPKGLESLRCDQLEQGARVKATYKMGPLRARQSYRIPVFDPQARVLEYRAGRAHPLDGGGRVEIEPVGQGARLRWSGSYRVRLRPDSVGAALYVKLFFEDRFFDTIARNLRAIEDARAPRPTPEQRGRSGRTAA